MVVIRKAGCHGHCSKMWGGGLVRRGKESTEITGSERTFTGPFCCIYTCMWFVATRKDQSVCMTTLILVYEAHKHGWPHRVRVVVL